MKPIIKLNSKVTTVGVAGIRTPGTMFRSSKDREWDTSALIGVS